MFFARLAQVISATVVLIASVVSIFGRFYGSLWLSFSAAFSALTLSYSAIGMFAFRRPRDVSIAKDNRLT